MSSAKQVVVLQNEVRSLSLRLERIERELGLGRVAARVPSEPEPVSAWAPEPFEDEGSIGSSSVEDRPRRSVDLEELLGGRLLALVGGLAVILGLAFLVALAVDRGWIGETARVLLAVFGSGALLGAGGWLYERKGRSQAALAMAGTGIAGLFLTLTAATALYGLVSIVIGLALALLTGALATGLAVRWGSRTVAGLGILGALSAPALVDAVLDIAGIAFLAIALAASAAVLAWRRWEWLRIAAFTIAMAQVSFWALDAIWELDAAGVATVVAGLAVFAVINLALALGYEVRAPTTALRPSSSFLVAANALVIGGIGSLALVDGFGVRAAGVWMSTLAAGYGAIGAAALVSRRVSRSIGLLLLAVALTTADIAFAFLVDGPALAIGWAVSAVGLAALARRADEGGELVSVALGGQLALAIGHVLMFETAPGNALEAASGAGPLGALGALIVSAVACARLVGHESERRRIALDGVSLAALAYATALALDGTPLMLAYAAEATALAQLARRTKDRVAGVGSLSFLVLAAGHVLAFEAPADGLLYGVDSLAAAALGLVVVAVVSVRAAHVPLGFETANSRLMYFVAGGAVVYLGSLAIADSFQPGAASIGTGLDLDVRQQGQALLSAFWSLCGLGLLWAGLRRSVRELRLAGFALLAVAVGKVFVYDLSALGSAYRVLSFIVLGLLLLLAAFVYQRMQRPVDSREPRGGRARVSAP